MSSVLPILGLVWFAVTCEKTDTHRDGILEPAEQKEHHLFLLGMPIQTKIIFCLLALVRLFLHVCVKLSAIK